MQFIKHVDPRFWSPLKPMVVIGLTTRRLRKRRSAAASCELGNQGMYGALIPNDLKDYIDKYIVRGCESIVQKQRLTLFLLFGWGLRFQSIPYRKCSLDIEHNICFRATNRRTKSVFSTSNGLVCDPHSSRRICNAGRNVIVDRAYCTWSTSMM